MHFSFACRNPSWGRLKGTADAAAVTTYRLRGPLPARAQTLVCDFSLWRARRGSSVSRHSSGVCKIPALSPRCFPSSIDIRRKCARSVALIEVPGPVAGIRAGNLVSGSTALAKAIACGRGVWAASDAGATQVTAVATMQKRLIIMREGRGMVRGRVPSLFATGLCRG